MPRGRIQSVYVSIEDEEYIDRAKRIALSKKTSFNKYVLQSVKEKLERDNNKVFYNPPPKYIPKEI